jgi:hypothetical protein
MRECARDKKVERCLDCSEFPCSQYNMDEHKHIAGKLPHLNSIINNITAIKSLGVAQWLEDQGRLWKCPDCQTDFSWYADNCSKCGKDLSAIKGFINEFDKSIFEYLTPKKS